MYNDVVGTGRSSLLKYLVEQFKCSINLPNWDFNTSSNVSTLLDKAYESGNHLMTNFIKQMGGVRGVNAKIEYKDNDNDDNDNKNGGREGYNDNHQSNLAQLWYDDVRYHSSMQYHARSNIGKKLQQRQKDIFNFIQTMCKTKRYNLSAELDAFFMSTNITYIHQDFRNRRNTRGRGRGRGGNNSRFGKLRSGANDRFRCRKDRELSSLTHFAAAKGNVFLAKILLGQGKANPHLINPESGITMVHHAAMANTTDVLEYLLNKEKCYANILGSNGKKLWTPLDCVFGEENKLKHKRDGTQKTKRLQQLEKLKKLLFRYEGASVGLRYLSFLRTIQRKSKEVTDAQNRMHSVGAGANKASMR